MHVIGVPQELFIISKKQSNRCDVKIALAKVVNVDKYYKMHLFKNDVGGITFVLGICDDVCLFKCIITTF